MRTRGVPLAIGAPYRAHVLGVPARKGLEARLAKAHCGLESMLGAGLTGGGYWGGGGTLRFHAAYPHTQCVMILCLSSGHMRKHLWRLPPGAVPSVTCHRVLHHLDALDLRMALWKYAMLHDEQAAASGTPNGRGMHFMSLNVRQSLHPKIRAASSLIHSFSFPNIISPQEIGPLLEFFSRDIVCDLMAWQPPGTPFTFPSLTISLLRDVLHDTPHTSPYWDLIEYVLLRRLSHGSLQPLLAFYNVVLLDTRVPALHHGDITLLPKKVPHGIVGNGRPLSRLSFLWKVFVHAPCFHVAGFPLRPRACVPCAIRHVAPHILGGCASSCTGLVLVLLVARPAGLAGFERCYPCFRFLGACHNPWYSVGFWLLSLVGGPPRLRYPLHGAAHGLLPGGGWGLARYEAGLGQGDPISALLYCLLGELRSALALTSTGLLAMPAGPLRRLGWIDDTLWLAQSHLDAQRLVSQLPPFGAATNLFSDK